MSARLPRRSTRSQSREVSVLSTDDDRASVVSEHTPKAKTTSRKPRASTRKVKKAEAIAEDEEGAAVEQMPSVSENGLLEAAPFLNEPVDDEELLVEELEEELEVSADLQPSIEKSVRSLRKPNKVQHILLGGLRFLGRHLGYLPPFLISIALVLATLSASPNEPFARKTYIDENALQPGSAAVEWGWNQVELADRTAERVASVADAPSTVRASFLVKELQSMGLAAYTQSYAFGIPTVTGKKQLSGVNTYARFPAARGDGREAFVLAAAWKSAWNGQNDPDQSKDQDRVENQDYDLSSYDQEKVRRTNVRGIALTLELARYLSGHGHWSKDLIFVFSDGELEGMQAWTSSYFGRNQSNLAAERLRVQGASIWNALAIDYPSDSFSHVVIKHEGLQGNVPNMDVINTLTRVAQRIDSIPVVLPASSEHDLTWSVAPLGKVGPFLEKSLWKDPYGARKYMSGLLNVLHQVGHLSSSRPSGIHGVFHQYHVDAITIFLRPAKGPFGFFHIGRVVESMTRSMSNLLERLHHSQFFYLLTSPYLFIELAKYLPITILLSAALFILGIAIWLDEGKLAFDRKADVLYAFRAALDEEDEDDFDDAIKNVAHAPTKDTRDVPLKDPTSGQLLSSLITLLVDRSLKRGELLGSSKLRSIAPIMQVLDRPTMSALAFIASFHAIGGYAYYILDRAPVDCARDGLLLCQPLRLLSVVCLLVSLLVVLRARRVLKLAMRDISRCQAQLPVDAAMFLLSLHGSMERSLARTTYSIVLLEGGIVTLATSLVNFSLALIFALLLTAPLCLARLPSGSRTITEGTTSALRAASPASNDSDNVEAITSVVTVEKVLPLWTRGRLYLHAILLLALSPMSMVYLSKSALLLACRLDVPLCTASSWFDWSFDNMLLQRHLLSTFTIPFIALFYVPITLAASAACVLAATSG